MKTLAELENENKDGFMNPTISDKDFQNLMDASVLKNSAENSNPDRLETPLTCYHYPTRTCSDIFNCCDCGGNGCECSYCFACNACESCYNEDE